MAKVEKTAGEALNKFETQKPVEDLSNIPFMKKMTEGQTFKGVYVGTGKPIETDNSEGPFTPLVFLSIETGELVKIPPSKVLMMVPEKFSPGEALIELTYLGVQTSGKGKEYHNYRVKGAELKTPLTDGVDFHSDYISEH